MRIESIADHPALVETIARWHWDEWGHLDPGGSLLSWTEGLRERTCRDRVPTTYVALDREEPIGSVTLVEHDMSTHRDLTPWLAGMYVRPDCRGQGVGSALVRHLVSKCADMGIERLYLYTHSARGFYEKLGWSHLEDDYYDGQTVCIMAFDTAHPLLEQT
jgi:GNAT superfamily N-acetyltransferase